jgi:type IV fimbrial biogenesis protein FimT
VGKHFGKLLAHAEGRIVLRNPVRGFTLIEMAVVIAIAGILLAQGIPAFHAWTANMRIRTVAESLQNDLRRAQTEAVRRSRQVALVLTDDTPTIANPDSTASTTARNWVLYALPLLGGDEEANEITSATNEGGTTGFILGFNQNVGTDTTVISDSATLCFNSVGRLTASTTTIANADDATCTLPSSAEPRLFRTQNGAGDRPLWVTVGLGGQIRLCDPNRTIPDQPGGCCSERCCGLSDTDYCVF